MLGDKPLYRWILDSLLRSAAVDRIVINTDAIDLLLDDQFPIDNRIELRPRATELCGDFVSMNRVIEDDVKYCGEGVFLMTHTTNPFISTETIEKGIDLYQMNLKAYDSAFSVTERRARFYDEKACAINHDPNNLVRTQDLPPYFEENSCLYVF